jgi:hypothetical protein
MITKGRFQMKKLTILAVMIFAIAFCVATVYAQPAGSTYTAYTPSQMVDCNQIDKALAHIPQGDGVSPVTDDEVGPGGWRFSSSGRSFVTFAYTINGLANGYDVVAGRSNVGLNAGVPDDYPQYLDLPQTPSAGVMTVAGRRAEVILTGDTSNDPPLFKLPGAGEGTVRINVQDPDKDGRYEGCAQSPLLRNFGFVKPEGGDFLQQEYFKAVIDIDSNGTVTFFEWTEVSTFKNTVPGSN